MLWPRPSMACTINRSYKAVVIQKEGPRQSLDDVERAALKWLDGFDNRRLLKPIGNTPPVDDEVQYYQQTEPCNVVWLKRKCFR